MRFWQHQASARANTARLLVWFAVLVTGLVLAVNALLALVFKLAMPFTTGWPALFFESNTAVILLFVLGGCWVESQRLREGGGARVARWMGGVEVRDDGDALRRRLLNVVDEMALASGQPVPQVFVMPRENAINAFAAGWSSEDSVVCVTQGALDRLTRAELQGLVAHEFGHLAEDDGRLSMRLLALVWGLSLIHGWGRTWMSANEDGHVNPLKWLVGAVLAVAGWLGWFAGCLLQAAVSRQREFLADARAIQFTRARDGLGQVLRKLLHEQQAHAPHLHHPRADTLNFMWLNAPGWASWLAFHPSLSERIRRLYGAARPALSASSLPEAPDRVMEPRAASQPSSASSLAPSMAPLLAPVPAHAAAHTAAQPMERSPAPHVPRLMPDPAVTEALGRLRRMSGPTQRRLALTAFMMTPGNEAEQRFWERSTRDLTWAASVLEDVRTLPAAWRVPEFERLLGQMAYEPLEERRALVISTREVLRADGRVSPRDRLWWLALRHRMGEVTAPHPIMRTMTDEGRDLSMLPEEDRMHVARFSAYLARLVPVESDMALPAAAGRAWLQGVLVRCTPPREAVPACNPPDADALMQALAGTQELSWMIRPQLVRSWVEEALNHSPNGLLTAGTADALRLAAGLLDTPLPPALASHYPRG